jgi:uncharacterized protein
MPTLIVLVVVGFLAQLIDGALGMAYGVSSTTLLLAVGISPAAASASVHLAELATTAASGAAHWRFGNVDWRVVRTMALPGFVGAFAGAVVLTSLSADVAKPFMAIVLTGLGVVVLARFALGRGPARPKGDRRLPKLFLAPLGLFGGFMDAAGGGGWGPIGTPALLASGRMEPRKVVGSIDTSEFLVALGASIGFLLALGSSGISMVWVGALVIGGLAAAPLAAYLVKRLPPRVLGTAVGGLIILTNAKTLGEVTGLPAGQLVAIYAAVAVAWAAAVTTAVRATRREALATA